MGQQIMETIYLLFQKIITKHQVEIIQTLGMMIHHISVLDIIMQIVMVTIIGILILILI